MHAYTRLPPGPAPADVLTAALAPADTSTPFSCDSTTPFDRLSQDGSVKGASAFTASKRPPILEESGSFRASAIHLGPGHHKSTRPPEVRSKQHAAVEGIIIADWVVLPDSKQHRAYWYITVAAAFLTALFEPIMFAFKANPGLSPYLSLADLFELVLFFLFLVDLVLSFFVAYHDPAQQVLVTEPRDIRRHYLRPTGFWLDLLGVVPLDYIVLGCLGLQSADADDVTARAVTALRWLRLVRCRRVLVFFEELEFDVRISQIWVTLARNQCYLFFLLHASACTYFWIARLHRFSENSWVGSSYNSIQDMDTLSQYVFSLYWSTITFSTVGYGDLHAVSTIEAAFTVLYCFVNVVVASYIIGTITVLVVKRDETTRDYRSRLAVLDAYNKEHQLPKALTQSMSDHLELHLHSAEVRDEAVLAVYPATIRRRILRYLYGPTLTKCQLLAGCPPRFLDTLLAAARVELFMGKVEILSEGDQVHDLHILLAGSMEQLRPSGGMGTPTSMAQQSAPAGPPDPSSLSAKVAALSRQESARSVGGLFSRQDSMGFSWSREGDSMHGGVTGGVSNSTNTRSRRRLVMPGTVFGEIPFFTHTPVQEAVRTLEVCRVLVISRAAWDRLSNDFILSASTVMSNLLVMCELDVVQELRGIMVNATPLSSTSSPPRTSQTSGVAQQGTASRGSGKLMPGFADGSATLAELQAAVYQLMYRHGGTAGIQQHPATQDAGFSLASLSPRQQSAVADLMRVRALAAAQVDAAQAARTHEFLSAASRGDAGKVREMLMQGQTVDVADYDDRTALMLACARGHTSIVEILLEVGADASKKDALGGTAALGAAKAGHDEVLRLLRDHGAQLSLDPADLAGVLCRCAAEGDAPLLCRLLSLGADASAKDYDGRSALHVAAGCGNEPAVKLLLAHGASASCEDNFGSTPLDDARRCGSLGVISLLEASLPSPDDAQSALAKFEIRRAERMLQACARGDIVAVRELLDQDCPVDACDYDERAGLELAAAAGHTGVVELLVSKGADVNHVDRVESCALLEACKSGHTEIIDQLVKAGGRLGRSFQVAARLCQAVAARNTTLLDCMLRAGADPTSADYDQRTAAHIAAADGQTGALALLLLGPKQPQAADATQAAAATQNIGPTAASPSATWPTAAVRAAKDRWGRTPLDEAKTNKHTQCVALLAG